MSQENILTDVDIQAAGMNDDEQGRLRKASDSESETKTVLQDDSERIKLNNMYNVQDKSVPTISKNKQFNT